MWHISNATAPSWESRSHETKTTCQGRHQSGGAEIARNASGVEEKDTGIRSVGERPFQPVALVVSARSEASRMFSVWDADEKATGCPIAGAFQLARGKMNSKRQRQYFMSANRSPQTARRGTVAGKRVATGTAGRAPVGLAEQEKPLKKAAVIRVDVERYNTWALIDSGADLSMINQDFARKAIHKDALHSGSFGHVTEAGGGMIKVAGKAQVSFQIRNSQFVHPMAIIPGLVYQIILGRDFCCRHGTALDDSAGVFKIGKHEIPLPTYEELRPRRAKVVTGAAVTLPPRSELRVDIGFQVGDGDVKTGQRSPWHGVLEPNVANESQDWCIPRIVATVGDNDTIPVQFTNIRGVPVTIPPNTDIGTFYTIQEDGSGMYEVLDGNDTTGHIPDNEKDKMIQDLHIDQSAVSDAGKRVLKRLVTEYGDIFSKNNEDIGKTRLLRHHINTGDAAPVRQRPRRIPLRLREEVEEQKNKMLRDGIIEESSSPWCSPIVLAKKKDGSFRFCVDLRAVNRVTQSLPHPLPRVDDALDSLAGAKFFSTLDMASGYWQVDLADEDKEKTAFTTGKGLHQFRAMPYGLKNAGATFQRLMELILAGMESRNCLVYIDDIIIFGETEQAHLKNLEEVFQRIRDAGMKLKPRKCCLARDEVVFLGHKVSRAGVQPDPANVAKVRGWPRPEKAEDLKSFLGLTGYYSKFVPGYSDLVKPIREEAEKRATSNGQTN